MPTSTFLSFELVNVGPLTTTFTPPPACETGIQALALQAAPFEAYAWESCPSYSSQGSCVPSGSEVDAISKTKGKIIWDFGWAVPYYSPGLHCPDGWTTAGVAEMSGDGEQSVTGIFSQNSFQMPDHWAPTPFQLPPVNAVASALDEGETAVICCKSGYTADALFGCFSHSSMKSYTATEMCGRSYDLDYILRPTMNVTFTYNGERVTGIEWTPTPSPTGPLFSVTTDQLSEWRDGAWSYDLLGFTSVEMITLIHRGQESVEETGSPSTEDGASITADPGSAEDDDSGAMPGLKVSSFFLVVAGISAILGNLC